MPPSFWIQFSADSGLALRVCFPVFFLFQGVLIRSFHLLNPRPVPLASSQITNTLLAR